MAGGLLVLFFKQKTAYEMRISDWSSDVCSSDLPARDTGAYVDPEDGNALIGAPDVVVIDTRNDYEVDIGTFSGAIKPQTASFRDFPDWFDKIGRASCRERVCQYV